MTACGKSHAHDGVSCDGVFAHEPVLLRDVLQFAQEARPALVVDCTVGGGGHAKALLTALPDTRLIGLDRDPNAMLAATQRLAEFGTRVRLVRAPFSEVTRVVSEVGWGRANFLLADLGVSSHQLDEPGRGFSFRAAGPLDMRMDPECGESAAEVLAHIGVEELSAAIRDLGEEKQARRVARAVLAARPTTTIDLAEAVRRVVPRGNSRIDPATRTFQAIRMLVNNELGELGVWLGSVPQVLANQGVAVAISFHSLEDRAVKEAWRAAARACVCPDALPVCMCGGQHAVLKVLTSKPVVAAPDEIGSNPRARSAKLRAARRIGGDA